MSRHVALSLLTVLLIACHPESKPGSCTPPSDSALCQSAGRVCGPLAVKDSCGADRAVECGSCEAGSACTDGQCACAPEADSSLCSRHGHSCGSHALRDNCGTERTVECGGCGAGELCASAGETCACVGSWEACAGTGQNCGSFETTAGCGDQEPVDCGTCLPAEECGGGGEPGLCGSMRNQACSSNGWCSLAPFPMVNGSLFARFENDVWLAGSKVLHWNGTSWTQVGDDLGFRAEALFALDGSTAWAAGSEDLSSRALLSRWNGAEWIAEALPREIESIQEIAGLSPSNVWAAGFGGLLHYDGASWEPAYDCTGYFCDFGSISASPRTGVWVTGSVGLKGLLLEWNGTGWLEHDLPEQVNGGQLWVAENGDLWLSNYGGVYRRHEGAWSKISDESAWEISGRSPSDVWMLGVRSILHWDGEALSEVPLPDGAPERLAVAGGAVLAIGDGDVFSRRGDAWEPLGRPSVRKHLQGVWGSGAEAEWAAGLKGTILHRTGDGWSALASPIPGADFFDVGGTSGDDVWFAGKANDRAVLVHWDGSALTSAGNFGPGVLLDLWVSSAGDAWAVGEALVNGAYQPLVLHREGGSWTRVEVPGYAGYYFVSISGGESGELWAVVCNDLENVVVRRVAGEWVSDGGAGPTMLIERIHVDGTGDVWAVGLRGQYEGSVWRRSQESGWSEVLTATSISLTGVCGTGEDVWVAGSGAWHWNGTAWEREVPTGAALLTQCWSNGTGDVTMVGYWGTIARHQAH